MRFSIIIPTLNRDDVLFDMLDSLCMQSFQDFEVIIVDQNKVLELDSRIKTYSDRLKIKHLKPNIRGASAARNEGIRASEGEILTFPDDDCEYPSHFLEKIDVYFKTNKVDGVVVNVMDKHDGKTIANLSSESVIITKSNILKTVIEAGITVRKDSLGTLLFDENLGVGSSKTPFWSDEGPDLLLNLLNKGQNFIFLNDFQYKIYHPNPRKEYNEKTIKRAFDYGMGRGYFLKKNNMGIGSIVYYLSAYIAGMLISIVKLNSNMFKYFVKGFEGRFKGYFLSKNYFK